MKMSFNHRQNPGQRSAAFTMVEIALCLAIIGFALVAIIGVLPLGLQTQKDNRADTIINKDGMLLMEAIRSGARGFDELTNYVDAIFISRNGQKPQTNRFLATGQQIIGLLSTPKYIDLRNGKFLTNTVTASMRAISGSATEHVPSASSRDLAFTYLVRSEIIPFTNAPVEFVPTNHLATNLYELRLRFLWPVLANGNAGEGRKTFRTLVNGHLIQTNQGRQTLYFFQH